jgi:hypothetical protein
MYDYVLSHTPIQESDRSCMIMLGPTPSQESERNFVGSIYGRSSLKIAHFVPIH